MGSHAQAEHHGRQRTRAVLGRFTVAVVLGIWLVTTAARVQVWDRPLTLWAEAIRRSPDKPRPWVHYGLALERDGATELAAWAYATALRISEQPARARLEGPMRVRDAAALNLASVWADQGRYAEALALSATIRDRRTQDSGGSIVEVLEQRWRQEQAHGVRPFAGF